MKKKFLIEDYLQNYNSELIQTLNFIKKKDVIQLLLNKSKEKITKKEFGVVKCFNVKKTRF